MRPVFETSLDFGVRRDDGEKLHDPSFGRGPLNGDHFSGVFDVREAMVAWPSPVIPMDAVVTLITAVASRVVSDERAI